MKDIKIKSVWNPYPANVLEPVTVRLPDKAVVLGVHPEYGMRDGRRLFGITTYYTEQP